MNYQETTEYLFNQMPMFERQGAEGYKPGLDNTLALDEHFEHPHRKFRSIHIAGTNGKGSCSHMISAMLQQCGYKVGLYTSPHLVDFKERIRINGKPIDEQYVVEFVEDEKSFFEPLHPSFFEVTTALAFKYFADNDVDIAVVEVGLGGRLDCTNIITPILSIITNISYDHTQFLGDTLAKIASEKAGIIKKNVPIIIGESLDETRPVFIAKAEEMEAPIHFAEDEREVLSVENNPEGGLTTKTIDLGIIPCELGGTYQEKNINTVLIALKYLAKMGYLADLTPGRPIETLTEELKYSLTHITELTGLMGRWQMVKLSPRVVCDTAHNVAGWQYISQMLENIKCAQMHIVFGMVNDKDIESVVKLLPANALYYFTRANNSRSIPEETLRLLALKRGIYGATFHTVEEAYKAAQHAAKHDDFIFIGGSNYIVGEFLKKCI